jgi:hypothetical protein
MWTRPDCAYMHSALSRVMDKPSDPACKALKRALRYLFNTCDYGLLYDFSEANENRNAGQYGYYDAAFVTAPIRGAPRSGTSSSGTAVPLPGCPSSTRP